MNLFHRRPLALVAVCFLTVSVILAFLGTIAKLAILGILCVSALVFLVYIRKRRALAVTLISLCLISILAVGISLFSLDRNRLLVETYDGETVIATAEVTEVLYEAEGYGIYAIRTETLGDAHVRLSLSLSCPTSLAVGDTLSGELSISSLSGDSSADHLYDWGQHIFGSASITSMTVTGHRHTPRAVASSLNEALCQWFRNRMEEDASSLICAMLLGNRSYLSSLVTYRFRRVGISHLLALSGMHISILAFAVQHFCRALRIPKRVRGVILILFLAAFALLTGLSASILRAAIMTAFVQLSILIRRDNDSFTSLFFAAAVIAGSSGTACLDLGLWLSVFATLGILLASRLTQPLTERFHGFGKALLRFLLLPILFTLSATLLTLPFTALFFGQFSLLGIPANLVFPTLMTFFLYLTLLSLPFPFLRVAVNWAAAGFLKLLAVFASCPSALLPFGQTALKVILFLTLGVILTGICFKWKHPRRIVIPLALCLVALLSVTAVSQAVTLTDTSVSYLSGGEDSEEEFLLLHDGGKTALCDIGLGTKTAYSRVVLPAMENVGENELDLLYLTHYHAGFTSVLADLAGDILIRSLVVPIPRTPYEETLFQELESVCLWAGIPLSQESSDHITAVGALTLKSLARTAPVDETEDAAVAFLATVRGTQFFYATADYTAHVFQEGDLGDAEPEVVILGRHGQEREDANDTQYPLDGHVTVLLLCNPDAGILFTEDEAAVFARIQVVRSPLSWHWEP